MGKRRRRGGRALPHGALGQCAWCGATIKPATIGADKLRVYGAVIAGEAVKLCRSCYGELKALCPGSPQLDIEC